MYRTTYKTSKASTIFRLLYRKSCHLPVEIEHKAHWTIKLDNFDTFRAGKKWSLQFNELDDALWANKMAYKTAIGSKSFRHL